MVGLGAGCEHVGTTAKFGLSRHSVRYLAVCPSIARLCTELLPLLPGAAISPQQQNDCFPRSRAASVHPCFWLSALHIYKLPSCFFNFFTFPSAFLMSFLNLDGSYND